MRSGPLLQDIHAALRARGGDLEQAATDLGVELEAVQVAVVFIIDHPHLIF